MNKELVLSRIAVSEAGCWMWLGRIDRDGYGRCYPRKAYRPMPKNMLAHRASYEIFKGRIPNGLTLDHLCRNRSCVNPKHLEPVTQKENIRRGIQRRNHSDGLDKCKHGHDFDKQNTYIYRGWRNCRKCNLIHVTARRKRIREQHANTIK